LFSLENPPERFILLDEICNILSTKGIDPANLFKSLLKTVDGELTFNFGNKLIQLEHTTAIDIKFVNGKDTEDLIRQDIIEISVSENSALTQKILTHAYRASELANIVSLTSQKTKSVAHKKKKNKQVNSKTKKASAKNKPTPKNKITN